MTTIETILGYIMISLPTILMSLFLFQEIQNKKSDGLTLALKDFIIAIDDGEPEKLSGAYIGAIEALDLVERND